MPKARSWSLSEEEKIFLLGRKNVAKYISAMIESEMSKYIYDVVRKRLGIEAETNVEVDIENGTIKLKKEKSKAE